MTTDLTGASYDRVAATYAATYSDELARKPLDRALLDQLVGAERVADLGSGPGQIGAYLRERGSRVIAVDLSTEMARYACGIAGDLRCLPLSSTSIDALVCFYAVIHLDGVGRRAAYGEFARILRPGGLGLVSFHISDAEYERGSIKHATSMLGSAVDLDFGFLDPSKERSLLFEAGLEVRAVLERAPDQGVEHPSLRGYLLFRRPE